MELRTPRVSIGLPVYNGENYLSHSLNRLLKQDFEDFELIISDNASTDSTREIVLAFAAKDQRIRYYRNTTNIGLAANHNRTFELSRGQFFKWAAHDDDFLPSTLSRFVNALEEAPLSVSLVYSRCEYIDEFDNVQGVDSDGIDKESEWPHVRLNHFLRKVHMYNCTYGLIRSEVLRRTRLFGLFPSSDHVLFAELAMLGVVIELPDLLLRIRLHSGRTFTANKDPKALWELFKPGRGDDFFPISLKTNMELELIRSAMIIPNTLQDKILCTAIAVITPQWWTFRAFGGRQKLKLRRLLSLRRVAHPSAK